MGAQFSRLKVWVKEKLKVADLNGEFNNILTNLTPAGIDDASVNAAAMQAVADPFPGSVLSLPTSTEGELRRLRFMLASMTGNTYWYEAPAKSIKDISDIVDQLLTAGQWVYEAATPTYISATQFSLPTDRTADFPVGLRIRAAVTAGYVYGTVTAATAAGAPAVTTITAKFDSGGLDVGLSAIKLGIISPLGGALPILPVAVETASFALSKEHHGKTIYANSETPIDCTMLTASHLPSGWWVDIINVGAGALTLVGTVEGVTNPVLAQWGRLRLMSNGTAWSGRMPGKADVGLGNVDNTADAAKSVSYAATAGSAASADSVANGSITQAKLEPVTPGLILSMGSAPTERSTSSTAYVKLKEFSAVLRGGTYTIQGNIKSGYMGYFSYYQVYINGSPAGSVFSTQVTGYQRALSDNYTLAVGDIVTIWGRGSGGSTAYVNNVVISRGADAVMTQIL